jgi:hypothetical protein
MDWMHEEEWTVPVDDQNDSTPGEIENKACCDEREVEAVAHVRQAV